MDTAPVLPKNETDVDDGIDPADARDPTDQAIDQQSQQKRVYKVSRATGLDIDDLSFY